LAVNPGRPGLIQYIVISVFIKKIILNIYFDLNYIFTSHSDYL
jgi:hypothetical protein